jgi:NifB/MoaA-like Fe-S oxidoreductase
VRLLTRAEAARALGQVDRAREGAKAERRRGWCYAADELFLLAGRSLPETEYYDDESLIENGVGSVRRSIDAFEAGLPDVPKLPGQRIRIATGGSMAPFFRERAERLAAATATAVEVVEVTNGLFGETVTVAGLLAGEDLAGALAADGSPNDLVLIPAEALNGDELFIDSLPLAALRDRLAPARVLTGHEVTAALRSL